jgi:uncharacterized protein with HEPN domain
LEALESDPVRLRAFERIMELVGECAKRLPEDLAYEMLWDALHLHFPQLQETVSQMLLDLEPAN